MATTTTKSAKNRNTKINTNEAIENRFLRVDLDARKVTWRITEKATGVVWQMADASDQDIVIEDHAKQRRSVSLASSTDKSVHPTRNGQPGAYIRLKDLGVGIHLFLDGPSLVVEVERHGSAGPAAVRDVLFPRHMVMPKRSDSYITWTVGQGSIVPGNWTGRFHHPEGFSEQEMCFHGGFAGGSGFVAIAETPFDLYIAMWNPEGTAPSAFIHWLPTLGDLRYTRRVRYTFGKGMGFVEQAKIYRQYMQREGYLVTLKEKAKRNPNVNRLKGAVVVNTATASRRMRTLEYSLTSFADQATRAEALRQRSGIKNAIVHVDGWGRFGYDSVHPETLPPNVEAGGTGALKAFRKKVGDIGWLFALHDQYIDIYQDAPSYHPSRLMIKENGKPNTVNLWCGGLCSHLCITESLKFLKRNFVDGVKDQYMYHNSRSIYDICQPDAYYLDCFCRIHECHNPEHIVSRSQVVHYTNQCLRTVHEHGAGVVLSCEHPKFYGVPDLEFGWGIGHLKSDVPTTTGASSTQLLGTPVALWHLVFHDCVWLPHWGNEIGEIMLYGESPYLNNTEKGPSDEEIAAKKRVCALNEIIAFDEMTDFRVSDDGAEFESEFASGVQVTLNRAEKTLAVRGARAVDTRGPQPLKEIGGDRND